MSNIFPMTTFLLNSDHWAESCSQLYIVNLPLLCTFLPSENSLKRQLFPLIEVNMLGNEENFVWDTDNATDTGLKKILIFSNWWYSQNMQQSKNDNFVLFHFLST